SKQAAALVMRLMLEPPDELPPALVQQIASSELELTRRQGRYAALAVASYFAFIPLLLWLGVREWPVLAGALVTIGAIVVLAYVFSRAERPRILWAVGLNALMLVLFSRIVTPVLLLPGLASAIGMTLLSMPQLTRRFGLVMAAMLGAVAVPIVL